MNVIKEKHKICSEKMDWVPRREGEEEEEQGEKNPTKQKPAHIEYFSIHANQFLEIKLWVSKLVKTVVNTKETKTRNLRCAFNISRSLNVL